jgi:hypothetical protein
MVIIGGGADRLQHEVHVHLGELSGVALTVDALGKRASTAVVLLAAGGSVRL